MTLACPLCLLGAIAAGQQRKDQRLQAYAERQQALAQAELHRQMVARPGLRRR